MSTTQLDFGTFLQQRSGGCGSRSEPDLMQNRCNRVSRTASRRPHLAPLALWGPRRRNRRVPRFCSIALRGSKPRDPSAIHTPVRSAPQPPNEGGGGAQTIESINASTGPPTGGDGRGGGVERPVDRGPRTHSSTDVETPGARTGASGRSTFRRRRRAGRRWLCEQTGVLCPTRS